MHHHLRNGLACVMAVVVCMQAGRPALAALSAEREAEIRALVEEARVHRAAGRFDQAIAALQRALDIQAAPWLLFNVGRVREVAGHHDLARRHYELAATAEDDAETRRKALEGVRRVDALAPRGVLRLRVAFPAGAGEGGEPTEVRIDGHVWEPRLGRDFNLARGQHVVEVTAPSLAPWRQSVELGELLVVEARLAREGEAPPAPVDTPPVAPSPVPSTPAPLVGPGVRVVEPASASEANAWLPWTVFGAGVAGAGVGLYLLVDGARDWDRVSSAPADAFFQDEAQAIVDAGAEKKELGTIAVIAGGGLAVGSLLWVVFGASEGQATVAPVAGRGVAGLEVSGRF